MGRHKRSNTGTAHAKAANPYKISKESIRRSTGSTRQEVGAEMALTVVYSLPDTPWRTRHESEATNIAALATLEEIGPRDTLEGMLAAQMLTVHNAAMECFRRGMREQQPLQITDMHLRHAARLTSMFERQLAALDKRRGQGQQTIRVEHVTQRATKPKRKGFASGETSRTRQSLLREAHFEGVSINSDSALPPLTTAGIGARDEAEPVCQVAEA